MKSKKKQKRNPFILTHINSNELDYWEPIKAIDVLGKRVEVYREMDFFTNKAIKPERYRCVFINVSIDRDFCMLDRVIPEVVGDVLLENKAKVNAKVKLFIGSVKLCKCL